MCGGYTAGATGSPTRRRGVRQGHPLSLRSTPRSRSRGGGRPSPPPRLPRSPEHHLGDHSGFARTSLLPGFATRSASSLPFPRRLRLLPLPPPSPVPVGAELGSKQRSARLSLDVGSGQVLRATVRDGQPLHQRSGHRGLEPAECGHPGHTRGGVSVLQKSS